MELDHCLAALRAAGMPSLVRVQTDSAGEILSALDSGATGLVLPHVISGEQAATIVRNSHYSTGGRGYAGSSRAAAYTTKPMAQHLLDSRATTTIIAQIEDAQALPHLDAIAATEGIDCLFVGRMDLTLSLGASSPMNTIVVDAVNQICEAGLRHGKAVGMFVPGGEDCRDWQRKGATLFLLASDQQFMLDGARALMQKIAPQT
jgi:2-keto-3-deoxy-L-rhamnonate aldolase RhmA